MPNDLSAGFSKAKGFRLSQLRLLHTRTLVVLGLLAAFIVWTVSAALDSAASLASTPEFGQPPSPFFLALNLWAAGAGLFFGLIATNPFAWLNGKRLALGGIAFAMMLGRLVAAGALSFVPIGPAIYGPLVFAGMPVILLVSGIGLIVAIGSIIGFFFSVFVAVPVAIFNQIFAFEHSLAVYRYQANSLAGSVSRFVYWLRNEPLPARGPDESKGARFATMAEIQNLHQPTAPESMAFGHLGNPVFLKTDKHILIMASTRSGKGVTLIIPHLLRYRGSAFVLDPKGENARATGRCRAQLNDHVHYLDPFAITGKPKSRFNPLARFTPENMEAESKALAAAMFILGDRERDHWAASGQQLLAALILYVYVSPDLPAAKKDLPQVRRLLLGGLKGALKAMTFMDEADGLLRDLAISFLETPEKEFGSIISTAQRQTEILDNPYMIACLSAVGPGPEVDFKAWRRGTMTVYLCLSAPKFPTFNRWLRLVLTSALDEMTETLDPPPLPVCFMLDELATLGHLAPVENAVGLAAGYGIQLINVFQDTAQMRDLYKGRWSSFIGNAGVRALFNLDDFDTAEYWSKFMGNRSVETKSRSVDIYGYSQGSNIREQSNPLLSTDKIMMDFASGRMLVLMQGVRPITTDRISYWDDSSLNGLWDDPRGPLKLTPPMAFRSASPASPPPERPAPPPSPSPKPATVAASQPAPVPKPQPASNTPRPAPFTEEPPTRKAAAAPTAKPAATPFSKPGSPTESAPAPRNLEELTAQVKAIMDGPIPNTAASQPSPKPKLVSLPAAANSAGGSDESRDPHVRDIREMRPLPLMDAEVLAQIPRNAPCPCGGGLKFKHCHGKTLEDP